ncbi:MAG: M6 family metalloprotease domain-containing protein [Acidaminobacteraceae bacterium]
MKKIITLLIFIIMFLQVPSYALETFNLKVVDTELEINDVIVEPGRSQFPILTYKEVIYLPMTWQNIQSLSIDVKFDSTNVFISKSQKIASGYVNGDEIQAFPESVNAVLPARKIYINNIILENDQEEYPLFEYKGVLYLPMSDRFAVKLLDLDLKFTKESGLKVNSDLEVAKVEELNSIDIQIENKKIIKDALNLEMSVLARLKDEEATIVYDSAKEYTIEIDNSQVIGLYKWDSGDRYAGQFKDGKFNGIGVYTWSSGQKYVGQFKDGDFNGIGRFYYNEESRSKISIFKDGVMEGSDEVYTEKVVEYSKNQKVLVLLTEFKNFKLRTSEEEWKDFMFGENDSISEYYKSESRDNLILEPVNETEGVENDGVVRVRLDYFHPDYDADYQSSFSIVRDSLEKANEFVDFDKYDTNGNGYIDKNELTIVNVVAGYEYVKNVNLQSIYAHRGTIISGNTIFDDTDIIEYIMIGELHYNKSDNDVSYMSTISIAAHEMAHAFGLPDLYDTDYSSNGIGPFGIMGTGIHEVVNGGRPGEKAVEFSAWSKSKLGFVKPKVVNVNGKYNLYTSKTGNYNNLRIDINKNEYLLVENKNYDRNDNVLNKDGMQSGVLIWHINNDVINKNYLSNTVNNDENNKGVDLVESDEITLKYSKLDADFKDRNFYPFFRASGISHYELKVKPESNSDEVDIRLIKIDVLKDGDKAEIQVKFN